MTILFGRYRVVPLKEVLRAVRNPIMIKGGQIYKQITVRLHHKGVTLRGEKDGEEIRSKQYLAREGQFVISKIDARNGAMGLIGHELDGAVVTGDFLLYEINQDLIFPKYFDYLTDTKDFIEECAKASEGTTNRVRLKPERFIKIEITLPGLEEQEDVVSRAERLLAKIASVTELRQACEKESRLLRSTFRKEIFGKIVSGGCAFRKIGEIAQINMGQSPPGSSYNKSSNGIPLLNGPTEFGKKYPTEIQWTTAPTKLCKRGDILICVRGATTGRMNWANKEYCIGRGLAALTPKKGGCSAEYLFCFVETQTLQMLEMTAGSTFPNLPGAKLRSLRIPVPSLTEQENLVRKLEALEKRMDAFERIQEERKTDLGVLTSSFIESEFNRRKETIVDN